jgi:branched-chain amino acid transport system substrate-binding protein
MRSARAPRRYRFEAVSRVYVSLPLTGPTAGVGRDVLRGAQIALEAAGGTAPELVVLDGFGADRDGQAIANARRAAQDEQALAYVGDFHSSQVASTAPILGGAGLLQVAPVATYAGLHGDTLVRLTPHDGVGARAIAAWLAERGVDDVLVVHDHDDEYGEPVGAMCAQAARERGLAVRIRPVWNHDEDPVADLGAARAVLYVGVAGSGAVGLWDTLHAAKADLWLLGSGGVAQGWFARKMSPAAAQRTRFFIAARVPMGFYGYEAMALVLDAIATGGGDRAATARAARATRDRDSVLGRYSVDAEGHTTSTAYGRLAVVDGALVWDVQPAS